MIAELGHFALILAFCVALVQGTAPLWGAWRGHHGMMALAPGAALAQAVLYMACAAKSNAVYTAYNAARADIGKTGSLEVPVHLRKAPTKLMKELGYGKAYRYAHDEPEAYAAGETYFPEDMPAVNYYRPVPRGLEIRIAEKLAHLRELDRKTGRKDRD